MSTISQLVSQQLNDAESPDEYISRAANFAEKAYEGLCVPGRSNLEYLAHVAEVCYMVSRVTDDPATLAAAWLHDVVIQGKATYEQIAMEFGYVAAGMVRMLTEKRDEPLEHFKAVAESEPVLNILVADYIACIRNSAVVAWVDAKGQVASLEQLLFNKKIDPRMSRVAEITVSETKKYLDNVIKDTPADCPRMSTGHPATLGVYRMLATQAWGPTSPAVEYLSKQIAEKGLTEVVLQDEQQMLMLLQGLNQGKSEV